MNQFTPMTESEAHQKTIASLRGQIATMQSKAKKQSTEIARLEQKLEDVTAESIGRRYEIERMRKEMTND